MKVPFIDLTRTEPIFKERWLDKITQLSANASFVGGKEIEILEDKLSKFVEIEYAISCANGTDALQLALRALEIKSGDVVLVPNLTFWATFEAVVNVGAVPKCVDSDAFGQLDLSSLKSAIDYFNPQCVIIAHLFGYSSNNLFQIRQICFDKNIPLLEDGAQCFGAKFKGEPLLKGAFISTTSFYPAKVLGAAGDAGAVFTNDRDLSEKVRTLSNHGRSSHYGYSNVGWNSRMDSIQAAYLNIAIDFLPHRIESRIDIINKYYLELPKLGINVIKPSVDFFENGYLNVCLFDNITEKRYVEDKLRKSTIGFGNVYPEILTKQKGAELYNNYKIVAKNSEKFSTSVLNLPVFPYLNEIEFQYIIETLKQS